LVAGSDPAMTGDQRAGTSRLLRFYRSEHGFTGAEKALVICFGLGIALLVGGLVRSGSQKAASDAQRTLVTQGGEVGKFQMGGEIPHAGGVGPGAGAGPGAGPGAGEGGEGFTGTCGVVSGATGLCGAVASGAAACGADAALVGA